MDLIQLAIDHINKMKQSMDLVKTKKGSLPELPKRLRQRARSIPSLILDAGLVPALLYYLSKTNPRSLEIAAKIIDCDERNSEVKEIDDTRETAYAFIASGILCVLKKLNFLNVELSKVDSIICGLEEIRRRKVELKATFAIRPYVIALKELAEAMWEG